MKGIVLAGLTAGMLALASFTPAQAQGGCGPYAHRGWDGFCHPGGWGWRHPHYGYGFYGHRPYGWHRPWGWHRGWGHGYRW